VEPAAVVEGVGGCARPRETLGDLGRAVKERHGQADVTRNHLKICFVFLLSIVAGNIVPKISQIP
jgi:hypothetical protein